MVQWLVHMGVRADIRNKDGKNAIQFCHLRRRSSLAALLTEAMTRIGDDDLRILEKLSSGFKLRDNYKVFSMADESEVDERNFEGSNVDVVDDLLLMLWRFCEDGNVNGVKYIYDLDIDLIKRQDTHGKASIHIATEHDRFQLVQWLVVEGGMRIDTFSSNSNTPFQIACICNYSSLALWLLHLGADPISLNVDGVAPLEFLCKAEHHDLFSDVIDCIGDFQPNMMFSEQRTLLHISTTLESQNIFDIMINIPEVNLNALDQDKKSPLHLAFDFSYPVRAIELVNRGASVGTSDSDGNTPLHCACRSDCTQATEFLLSLPEAAVHLHSPNKNGDTCLHLAASHGSLDLVKLLLYHEADPFLCNHNGYTALECACSGKRGLVEIAKLLVKSGCNPERRNEVDGSTALHLAARRGHIGLTIWLIKKHVHIVDSVDYNGFSPFLEACKFGHLRVMKLLYNTEEVNAFNLTLDKHNSALFLSCAGNHIAASTWLVSIGLNPNSPNADGMSPTDVALLNGREEVTQNLEMQFDKKQWSNDRNENFNSSISILLEESLRGNNLEYSNQVLESILQSDSPPAEFPHGKHLIHYAASCGNMSAVDNLISRGVDPNVTTADGRTPLFYAAARGHMDVVALIHERGGDILIKDVHGNSILDMAIRYKHDEIIAWLDEVSKGLDEYRDLVAVHNEDKRQSIFACFSDVSRNNPRLNTKTEGDLFDFDAVEKSSEMNKSYSSIDDFDEGVEDCDCYENVVLMRKACISGDIETVKKFTEHGISLDGLNDVEYTYLHCACSGGSLGAVVYLLEHGASPNIADEHGNTPLHEACEHEFVDIAIALIQYGASHTIANEDGDTPFHFGARRGTMKLFSRVIDLPRSVLPELDLSVTDAQGRNLIHIAAVEGHTQLLNLIVSMEVLGVNQTDSSGKTALHHACAHNCNDTVLCLIKLSALIDVADDKGYTPLMYAVATGNFNMAKWLVQQGSSPFTTSLTGNTALHVACSKGNLLMVKWLVECGLKADVVNKDDLTPMEYAIFKGYTDIVTHLSRLHSNTGHLPVNDLQKGLVEVDIFC